MVPSSIVKSPKLNLNAKRFWSSPLTITTNAPEAPKAKTRKVLKPDNFRLNSCPKHNEINGSSVKIIAADVALVYRKE